MAPFNYMAMMAYALIAIAAALWIGLLKSFGFWRWCESAILSWLDPE